MESFSDKLKSLGFKPAANILKKNPSSKLTLEEKIDGKVISNSLGEFVLKESFYPYGYSHGKVVFQKTLKTETLQRIAKIFQFDTPIDKMVFLDTETSGLSGGSGTFAFLVGVGRFQADGFSLQQLVIRNPLEENAMLLYLANYVLPDDVFVTYNGKSFDIPILLNRFTINRMPSGFSNNAHLDLLHVSRKIWRNQLPSCGLKDLEKDVLAIARTDEDIPGWMIPDIYFEYLRTQNPERICNVIYHNAIDVVSLAALFIHSSKLIHENKEHKGVTPGDLLALGKAFTEINEIQESINIYAKYLEIFPEDISAIEASHRLGELYRKSGMLESALHYWELSAKNGSFDSCICLAKYFEHGIRDYTTALYWTREAKRIASSTINGQILEDEITHRIDRLLRKAGN